MTKNLFERAFMDLGYRLYLQEKFTPQELDNMPPDNEWVKVELVFLKVFFTVRYGINYSIIPGENCFKAIIRVNSGYMTDSIVFFSYTYEEADYRLCYICYELAGKLHGREIA